MKTSKYKKIKKVNFGTLSLFCLLLFTSVGCKKLIEVDPPIQSIVGKQIYDGNSSAASVLTGIYISLLQSGIINGVNGLSVDVALSADELTLYEGASPSLDYFYHNSNDVTIGNHYWDNFYRFIFKANAAIEGITGSRKITTGVKQQLLGEAKFLRAFCYFYLVNLYGDVPLVTSTDVKTNANLGRSAKDFVYQQIITDLLEAEQSLNENYLDGDIQTITVERVRPNKSVARALLARIYLYTEQYDKAEQQASTVINNAAYSIVPLDQVFLKNSQETIWSLQIPASNYNFDGLFFNFLPEDLEPNGTRPVYISSQLWNAFEPGDQRKIEWAKTLISSNDTYPYVNKYKTDQNSDGNLLVTEYPLILRLAEQYLIRAEARARQGKLIGTGSAQSDVDAIRSRAGLTGTNASSLNQLLITIDKERQVELFTEFGNRWFDLKRRKMIDLVMPAVCISKGTTWEPFKALYPLPVGDLLVGPGLRGHQNPGYANN